MTTQAHVNLVWHLRKDMLAHCNKSNTLSTISTIDLNMRTISFSKHTMLRAQQLQTLPHYSPLVKVSMRDGTTMISQMDHILTSDTIDSEAWVVPVDHAEFMKFLSRVKKLFKTLTQLTLVLLNLLLMEKIQ